MLEFIMEDGGKITIDEKKVKKEARKARIRKQKVKIKQKVEDAKEWICVNQEFILGVAVPVLLSATTLVIKCVGAANRRARLRQEKDLKELYCYDRSLGHYWKLKRPLKNSDWVKINTKIRGGEKLGDILSDMNVLK